MPRASASASAACTADAYADSYAHWGVHEELIRDDVRTRTFRKAILDHAHVFRGKVVLDVGCGTGILSLFCARAGAKAVYAIECSAIAETAADVMRANGMEGVVHVVRGKAEEVQLSVEEVDVIVSEWMGYFLFYESMLDTVVYCRDKWLKPGGLMFTDVASLHVAAMEDAEYREQQLGFWQNVHGFDMSCIRKLALAEPLVDVVQPAQVVTAPCIVRHVDVAKLETGGGKHRVHTGMFEAPFEVVALRNDYVHAFVAHFDVSFTQCHKPVGFSTSPKHAPTHWKQTVFYLEEPITICKGEQLQGLLRCRPNALNPRDLDIELEYRFNGKHMSFERRRQVYHMR